MKLKTLLAILLIPVLAGIAFGQKNSGAEPSKTPAPAAVNPARFSPAYAEILLLKTEREAQLESLLIDYTEEYPKIKEARFQLTVIQKDMERLLAVKPAEVSKLTLALGKLMVRKVEIETDVWALRIKYSDDHPEVKRAKRKLEIFEAAVKDILG
jgi:hypothetical protein